MIKAVGFSIIFISLILLSLFIIFGAKQYQVSFGKKYSFLNMFPDEIIIRRNKEYYVSYIFSFYCLTIFISSIFYILPIVFKSDGYFLITGTLYPLLILNIVTSISLFLMVVIYPIGINYKVHITCFVIYVVGVIAKSLMGIFLFNSLQVMDSNLPSIFKILCFIGCLVLLVFLFNPSLSRWYKMNKETNKTGEETISRPKKLPLAYTEWFSIFGEVLNSIIIILGILLII